MPTCDIVNWLPPYLAPFFALSHRTDAPSAPDAFPDSAHYNTGPQDVCLLITCMTAMAVLRDVLRLGVFEPFVRWRLASRREKGESSYSNRRASRKEGRRMHRTVLRFAEQGWPAVYYPLQFVFGLPTALWLGYPHAPLPAPVKFYYITQTAFYVHQILVLNAEAPRKDHVQMMSHHFITVFLMGASYVFNFTRVGCLIMVLMDCSDIFLPIAKMMRYMDVSQHACDSFFGCYLVSWFVTRHVLFILVIVSTYTDLPRLVPFEWAPTQGRFLSRPYWIIFCACLTALQILQIIWFGLICRIAWKVVTTGEGASDERSDDER
ncbi:TLC domain-containing protein [Mycena rosella]|uniref:TLC domain-containing protein n=1 Tax=Mycena rosella TaxID=1033263 RepID=A0AAD7D8Z1_MYCRO|nr:TLC domain-containing protein [Mycena rosella]